MLRSTIFAMSEAVQVTQKGAKAKKPPKPRVDHFISIPLNTPSVCKALETVQSSLLSNSVDSSNAAQLQKCFVEPCTAHITLAVMALSGEVEGDKNAAAVLREAVSTLHNEQLLKPFSLKLGGLSHFNNKVLYLDVVADEGADHLARLADTIRAIFLPHGWATEADNKAFAPHITIAKLSKLQGDKGWHRKYKRHKGRNKSTAPQGGNQSASGRHLSNLKNTADADAMEVDPMEGGNNEMNLELRYGGVDGGNDGDDVMESNSIGMDVSTTASVSMTNPSITQELNKDPALEISDAHERETGGAEAETSGDGGVNTVKEAAATFLKQINPELYAEHVHINVGCVEVTEIQLCSMKDRKAGQYYQILERISLTEPVVESLVQNMLTKSEQEQTSVDYEI